MDNDRLLKALLISVLFHGLLFFGINLLDWFPETGNQDQYGLITVKLEKINYPIVKTDYLIDQISEKEITKNEESIPQSPVTAKRDDVGAQAAVTADIGAKDTTNDPYADIGKTSDPVLKGTSVETAGNVKQETEYVPSASDSIKYEVPVKGMSGSPSQTRLTENKTENTIISSTDMSELENALSSDNNNPPSSLESDKTVYQYNDSPVDFDTEGINRKLISNPYPELPANLPADFPIDFHYQIRFSLNADGLIKVLSITPSSVYPSIDASIRNALRSWTFNQAAGTEDVKGTITLIFKGR